MILWQIIVAVRNSFKPCPIFYFQWFNVQDDDNVFKTKFLDTLIIDAIKKARGCKRRCYEPTIFDIIVREEDNIDIKETEKSTEKLLETKVLLHKVSNGKNSLCMRINIKSKRIKRE